MTQHELSDLQIDVMRVLWTRTEATVQDVHAELLENRELAPTTVATILSRLEKRGIVSHRVDGRQYVYRALISESEVRTSMLRRLSDTLFGGRVEEMLSHLVSLSEVEPGDLARLREMIAEREQEMGGEDG